MRPRIVYLANPDNPSGSFAPRDAVSNVLATLPNDALLLLDEAYGDFVPANDLIAPAVLPRVVRTRTFSKAYGLAGARIAYALAEPAVVATFQKIRHHYGVNRTAQVAALAALSDGAFVAGVVAEVARGRASTRASASGSACRRCRRRPISCSSIWAAARGPMRWSNGCCSWASSSANRVRRRSTGACA